MMSEELAVYVHIPFCQYKCTFCDFATVTGHQDQTDQYVEALLQEIRMRAPAAGRYHVPTVFFGGGTPSLLPARQIARILEAIDRVCPLAPNAEISLESNPGTLPPAHLRDLLAAGVTRLSVGVQSLNDDVLRAHNRLHNGMEALETLRAARAAGFASVNADLIYGLPGQDRRDWEVTLQGLLSVEPDHLSIYGLIVEPGTLLRRQITRGDRQLPDDDEAAEMYERARDALIPCGYVQYEVSNWARPGHQCRHNLVYWHHRPYLGLGLSSHSYFEQRRFANMRGLQSYLKRLSEGLLPTASSEQIDAQRARADATMLGLRLIEGIHVPTFDDRFGGCLLVDHAATIERLAPLNLLEVADDHLRLTPRGYLLANQVWQEFI